MSTAGMTARTLWGFAAPSGPADGPPRHRAEPEVREILVRLPRLLLRAGIPGPSVGEPHLLGPPDGTDRPELGDGRGLAEIVDRSLAGWVRVRKPGAAQVVV